MTQAEVLADDLGVLERIGGWGQDLHFGLPTPCPECGELGWVDEIDGGADAVQFNQCNSCRAHWAFSAKALMLFVGARDQGSQMMVGSGVLFEDLGWDESARRTAEHFIDLRAALSHSRQIPLT